MEDYFEDIIYSADDILRKPLSKGEYENCSFNQCDLSDHDLSDCKFMECIFTGCNLSLANITDTAFQDVRFVDCKMLGLQFDTCNNFGLSISFIGCQLNHSTFHSLKISKIVFENCELEGVDYSETDLSSAIFDNCNLLNAVFDHTILEKADFRSAYNFSLDPETNRVKKAKFSAAGLAGLLVKYNLEIE